MNKYRVIGIVVSIIALLFSAGCGGGNPTPAPKTTGLPPVVDPKEIPTPPVQIEATPTYYKEFPSSDGSNVQVWSFTEREIGKPDIMYAGSLGLVITTTQLTAGQLVAIVVVGVVIYYIFLATIVGPPPVLYIPEVAPAPEPGWYVMPTTEQSLVTLNAQMSGAIPQLTPQDLQRGIPTEAINITWGTLTWYSWCNQSGRNGPELFFGFRFGETLDNRTIKVPGCDQFPLSKNALISLVRSFKDTVRKVFSNLPEGEILKIISDIDDFANLLVKYLPNF